MIDFGSRSDPRWRWLVIVALTTTAGIHITLVPQHLREAPYAGALFIALSASALTAALLLAMRDHQLAWLAAGTLSLAALVGYLASRSIGLPSLTDDIGDWLNPLGIVASLCETAVALISWHALSAWHPPCSFPSRMASITTRPTATSIPELSSADEPRTIAHARRCGLF